MKNIFAAILLLVSVTVLSQETNKKDSKGQRHGVWKGVYDDTKLPRYEGTFEHGKETGIFKFYDNVKKSPVVATRDFSAGDGSCFTTFFAPDGQKNAEGREVNKQREGEWKFYQEKGLLLSTETYSNGKLTGVRKVFYPNKVVAEETTYANGIKEGAYKKYTEKGTLLEETVYKNDVLHGKAAYRTTTNQPASEGMYKNGKKHGVWKFYKNGKLDKEVDMSAKNAQKQLSQ